MSAGCTDWREGRNVDMVRKSLTLPRLRGTSAYERALESSLRLLEGTERYRDMVTRAVAMTKGASSCALIVRAGVAATYSPAIGEFDKPIEIVYMSVVLVCDTQQGPGYVTTNWDAALTRRMNYSIVGGTPSLDGISCGILLPMEWQENGRRVYKERTGRRDAIRQDIQRLCHPSQVGVNVAIPTRELHGGTELHMYALADGSGVQQTISLDTGPAETDKAIIDLWGRIWDEIRWVDPDEEVRE